MKRLLILTALGALLLPRAVAAQACLGDCNGDGRVAVNELIIGVNIALEESDLSYCSAFDDGSGVVSISVLIRAVNNSLDGCPATPTATEGVASTPTEAVTPTATGTVVGTATATVEVTETATPDLTATATEAVSTPPDETATPDSSPTETSPPTSTATPEATEVSTETPVSTAAATESATVAPSDTPATSVPTETATAAPSDTPGETATVGATETPTEEPTGAATPASTETATETVAPTETATETAEPTETPEPSETATAVPTEGATLFQGALVSTTGRFTYQAIVGIDGADAECDAQFAGSHACTIDELQAAEAAGELVGAQDTGGMTVTSFWAIDGGRPNVDQCHVSVPWDYATAHTGQFADSVDLDNGAGSLSSLHQDTLCALQRWVGCCL